MTITFNPPATRLTCLTEIALGADLAADPTTWVWTDVTAYVRHAAGVSYQTGRADQWSNTDETSAELVFDNRAGRFSRHNPSGPYYGQLSKNTPLRSGFDAGEGTVYPVEQYVTEWPNRWDISRTDKTTKIKCAGVRRRLAQGAVARSDMRRTYETMDEPPTFYWPMEEEDGASSARSVYGGVDLTIAGDVSFGASGPAGSAGAADLSGGGKLSAAIAVPGSAGNTADSWEIELSFSLATIPTDTTKIYHLLTLRTPASVAPTTGVQYYSLWAVPAVSGLCYLSWSHFAEADGLVLHGQAGYLGAGQTYNARLTVADAGADISSEFGLDDGVAASTTLSTKDVYNPNRITICETPPFTSTTVPAPAGYPALYQGTGHGLVISHVGMWMVARTDPTTTFESTAGHVGETAGDRMTRVCEQEGIPFTMQTGETVAMGPQPVATPLDILDDCAKSDLGVLYQANFGLAYQPTDARTNADSQMSISFAQLGEAPESADDDAVYRNQWTVSRSGGASATESNEDGIAYNGLYDDETQVSIENDSGVRDQAGWRTNRDSIDVPRWPDIFLNFANAAATALISDFTALDFGPMITLTSPPSPHPTENRLVFIEGVNGFFTPLDFTARLTTSPADAYRVGIFADDVGDTDPIVGRYLSDGSTLRAAVTAGATSFDVDSGGGMWWTTTADDFDPDLRLRLFPAGTELHGEEIDVSAVSDVAGSFVSVGLVVGGTGAGPATPGMPASIASGDTLFLVAVNRNIVPTVTAPVISSADWTLVADDAIGNAPANLRVWARTYDGVFTAPSITFGGGGTVDYQAQICAFRGLPLDVSKVVLSYAATYSDSSANIAAPLMRIRHRRRLLIAIGWRADDWTSVATYVATGTTFTEISEPDVTAGDDQGFVWDYAFQTSAVDVPAGSFVVTGGGAAATRGVMLVCDGGHQTMTVAARGAGGTTARAWSQYDRVEVAQPAIPVLAAS